MSKEVILQVGVKILLRNSEGKYLLLRRNPEKYPEVGAKWDIVGGRIDPGGTLLDNLKREIKEETRLDYTGEPQLVGAQDILRVEGKHIVRLTYVGEIEGEPQIDEESMEYKWFTAQEVKDMERDILDEYLDELIETGRLQL